MADNTIFILNRSWESIRHLFSEAEKVQLREAVVGEAICPRGWVVDLDQLPVELRTRLKAEVTK